MLASWPTPDPDVADDEPTRSDGHQGRARLVRRGSRVPRMDAQRAVHPLRVEPTRCAPRADKFQRTGQRPDDRARCDPKPPRPRVVTFGAEVLSGRRSISSYVACRTTSARSFVREFTNAPVGLSGPTGKEVVLERLVCARSSSNLSVDGRH